MSQRLLETVFKRHVSRNLHNEVVQYFHAGTGRNTLMLVRSSTGAILDATKREITRLLLV